MKKTALSALFIFCFSLHSSILNAKSFKTGIILKWYHQSQFAGFYVAQEKNFYKKENLDVEIFEGGPDKKPLENVFDGSADFGITSPEELLTAREENKDIVAIAAVFRKSAVVFLSKKNSKILTPFDFPGKTIAAKSIVKGGGASEFEIQLKSMLKNLDIKESSVNLTNYDHSYKNFYNGNADITPAYITAGLVKIKSRGITPNIIWPGDYKIRFYSDIIITNRTVIKKDPELVFKFLKASLKGWQFATEDIEETLDIILKYSKIKDRKLQKDMLEASFPLVYTGSDYIGYMSDKIWKEMHDILLEQQILKKPLKNLEKAYSLEFLQMIQEGW